jgi:hypothetical protein
MCLATWDVFIFLRSLRVSTKGAEVFSYVTKSRLNKCWKVNQISDAPQEHSLRRSPKRRLSHLSFADLPAHELSIYNTKVQNSSLDDVTHQLGSYYSLTVQYAVRHVI